MLEGAKNRGRWRRVFWGKEVEEEGIVYLKGRCGIGYGGKAIRRPSNSQLFSCPDGPRVYRCQELFPVGDLYLLDSVKVLVLEVFCVGEGRGSSEFCAPSRG